ncbi:hypothetical protein LXL04_012791 [Taraxacum kok-saghyz]
MNRQGPYGDPNVNRYAASQPPQMSAQRMQQNAQTHDFHGRQHWDTNPYIELNPMSPHSYSQGNYCYEAGHKVNNIIQSHERIPNQNQTNNKPRLQSHEQDMEIGYEDTNNPHLTSEGLEQRFQDEIMKLIKEQSNAEDEENARHKKRIVEINTRYQENLSSLRVRHESRVGEFLQKESQTRVYRYQQAANANVMKERGPHDYGGPYGTIPDESYREHPQYREAGIKWQTAQATKSQNQMNNDKFAKRSNSKKDDKSKKCSSSTLLRRDFWQTHRSNAVISSSVIQKESLKP